MVQGSDSFSMTVVRSNLDLAGAQIAIFFRLQLSVTRLEPCYYRIS